MNKKNLKSNIVKDTLSKEKTHQLWIDNYRNKVNEKFFILAFNYIAKIIGPPKEKSLFLDIGCGSASHSIRLAKLGFDVIAVDYSKYVLEVAKDKIQSQDMENKISTKQDDLLGLSFEDESFENILCWGVLMHIPDINTAISELSRVLKKGGKIIISEINMSSFESLSIRMIRPLLNKPHIKSIKTIEGLEVWNKTKSEELLSRKVNVSWLINRFKQEGVILVERKSGQFTEAYTRFSNKFVNNSIHKFNNFWFKHINLPSIANGNIIILEKSK